MPEPVVIQCPECQAKLKLADDSKLGKKIGCPKCKVAFIAKAASAAKSAIPKAGAAKPAAGKGANPKSSQPMKKVKPKADDDNFDDLDGFDDFDDDNPAPKKKKSSKDSDSWELPAKKKKSGGEKSKKGGKKSSKSEGNPLLWVGLGVGSLLVVGLLVFFLWPAPKPKPQVVQAPPAPPPVVVPPPVKNKLDLAWLPPDANGFLHVRVGEALSSSFMNAVFELFPYAKTHFAGYGAPGIVLKDMDAQLQAQDVEIITLAFQVEPEFIQLNLEEFRVGLSEGRITPLRQFPEVSTKTALIGGVIRFNKDVISKPDSDTIVVNYRGKDIFLINGDKSNLVCLINQRIQIAANDIDKMKAIIDRSEKIDRRADLDFIDPTQHVFFVGTTYSKSFPPSTNPDIPQVKSMCVGMKFAEQLQLSLAVQGTDSGAAIKIAQEFQKVGDIFKSRFVEQKDSVPINFGQIASSLYRKGFVLQTDELVAVTMSLPEAVLVNLKEIEKHEFAELMVRGLIPLPAFRPDNAAPPGTPPTGTPPNSPSPASQNPPK